MSTFDPEKIRALAKRDEITAWRLEIDASPRHDLPLALALAEEAARNAVADSWEQRQFLKGWSMLMTIASRRNLNFGLIHAHRILTQDVSASFREAACCFLIDCAPFHSDPGERMAWLQLAQNHIVSWSEVGNQVKRVVGGEQRRICAVRGRNLLASEIPRVSHSTGYLYLGG